MVARKLTWICRSISSSVTSSNGVRYWIDAQTTSTSRLPSAPRAALTQRAASSGRAKSASIAAALRPSASMAATVSLAASGLPKTISAERAKWTATSAPASAKASAISLPMLTLPPVTSALRPCIEKRAATRRSLSISVCCSSIPPPASIAQIHVVHALGGLPEDHVHFAFIEAGHYLLEAGDLVCHRAHQLFDGQIAPPHAAFRAEKIDDEPYRNADDFRPPSRRRTSRPCRWASTSFSARTMSTGVRSWRPRWSPHSPFSCFFFRYRAGYRPAEPPARSNEGGSPGTGTSPWPRRHFRLQAHGVGAAAAHIERRMASRRPSAHAGRAGGGVPRRTRDGASRTGPFGGRATVSSVFLSQHLWIPKLVVLEHGIQDDQELVHACRHGHLVRLARSQQTRHQRLDHRIAVRRAARRHVQHAAHVRASALHIPLATTLATVVGKGGHAHQCRDALGVDRAQLRQTTQERGHRHPPDARSAVEQLVFQLVGR